MATRGIFTAKIQTAAFHAAPTVDNEDDDPWACWQTRCFLRHSDVLRNISRIDISHGGSDTSMSKKFWDLHVTLTRTCRCQLSIGKSCQ